MSLSVSEQAIINFYEFDYKGRGYYHFPFCVALEPPFVPFSHVKTIALDSVDDGKVPSLLTQFAKFLLPKEKEKEQEEKELKPNIIQTRPKLVALELSFSKRPYIDKNLFVEFLNMLSFSKDTISFEIIGTFEKITIQIVCSLADKMRIQAQFRELLDSLLPRISIKEKTKQQSKKHEKVVERIHTVEDTIIEKENNNIPNDDNNVPETIKQKLHEQSDKSKINREHNYLQTTIKKLGQDKGFLSTIEKEVSNGGRVDVVLERDGFKIACEISVTNKIAYELKNIQKCITDNFDIILMVSKNKKHLNSIKDLAHQSLAKKELK